MGSEPFSSLQKKKSLRVEKKKPSFPENEWFAQKSHPLREDHDSTRMSFGTFVPHAPLKPL